MKALGDARLKCCIQVYHSLALITNASVRGLVRSVEEPNGAEAWRLIHSRCAPDTQNRQYALMQKIMMPVKPWCDHTEGFESALRGWELDVGEWERASGTALADAIKYPVTMNMTPIVLGNSLQLGTYANSAALRTALLQWCYFSRNFGAFKKNGKGKGKHKTRKELGQATQTSTPARTVALSENGTLGGRLLETRWRSIRQLQQQQQQHRQRQEQQERQQAKANSWTENSLDPVVSLVDTEHDCGSLVQSRRATTRLAHDPGRRDNQFTVFNKETSWCRVLAS